MSKSFNPLRPTFQN